MKSKTFFAPVVAIGASLFAAVAIAQQGAPCSPIGKTWKCGDSICRCVPAPALGQAQRPNWDGRDREPNQPAAIKVPQGMSPKDVKEQQEKALHKSVFPGLDDNAFRKLQNSPEGRKLIQEAQQAVVQKKQAEKDFDAAMKSWETKQMTNANQTLDKANKNVDGMQQKAGKILIELQ